MIKNKTAILIFSSLYTFFFTINVQATNEDGNLIIYNMCKKPYFPNSAIKYHIIPISENCSRKDIYLLKEQVTYFPVITYSTPSNLCQYYLTPELDGVVEKFGPFSANSGKTIVCGATQGPCKCVAR